MVPNADLRESHSLHRRLRGLDLAQRPDRDRRPVRDARRKAGEGWLVPVGQTKRARRGPDLGLRHPRLEQREANTATHRGRVPRPVVAGVVGGGAVRQVRKTELRAHRLEGVEQLLLAVEAAVRMVARVGLEFDLPGGDLDQARAHRARELACGRLL